MDAFHEQLYKRKTRPVDILMRIAIAAIAAGVSCVAFIAARAYLGGIGRIISVLAVAAIVYVAYKIAIRFDVEFEYTYFNGELDIDKIMNQTSRKRIITVQIKTIQEFGRYTPDRKRALEQRDFDTTIDVRSLKSEATVYYAVFKHASQGNCLLMFEPDEITLTEMRKVRRDLLI